MNDTPTPRTDESDDKIADLSPNAECNYALMKAHARKLERELAAVTEQRDSYKDRFESLLKRYAIETHQLTEQRDRLLEQQEQWRLSSVCRELVEQRDRLADALNKMISICSCETEDIDTVNEIRYFVDTITKHSNP